MDTELPGIGHNVPPREQMLREEILERHKHLTPRTSELLAEAAKVPSQIAEEQAGKVADFVKSIAAQLKAIEGARQAEKEEYLKGARVVDGIFRSMSDPLKTAKTLIEERLGIVLRAREERRRKEAEEKARLEREAAEKRRREAEEAAARERAAAEEARRQAEEAERKLAAEREQRRLEEEARQKRLEEERLARQREQEEAARKERERIAAIEKERAEAAERTRKAKEAAEEAGRKRDAEVRAAQEAERRAKKEQEEAERAAAKRRRDDERREREAAQRAEDERKEQERQARERERAAKEAKEAAERAAREAERVAGRAERAADKAAGQENAAAAKERQVEGASPATYARLRGDYGGVGTLSRFWSFANIERDKLDLEALRQFIPMDGLEAAVRAFVDAGGRELVGVDIFEDDKASVR